MLISEIVLLAVPNSMLTSVCIDNINSIILGTFFYLEKNFYFKPNLLFHVIETYKKLLQHSLIGWSNMAENKT